MVSQWLFILTGHFNEALNLGGYITVIRR